MMLDVCLGTRTSWKIILLMAEAPGKAVSRKDIYSHTKIGRKMLDKTLLLLKKFSIIQETKQGRQFLYKLNMADDFAREIVAIAGIERKKLNALYFSSALVLREFVYELAVIGMENFEKVVLFGSVAKHTASLSSDIDVAIVFREKSPSAELLISSACGKIEKRFGRKIEAHYLTSEEYGGKGKLADEIRRDGIVLV